MRKTLLVLIFAIWITAFAILVIALTDLVPDNPLVAYRLIIGMGFITLSSFNRWAYRRLIIR